MKALKIMIVISLNVFVCVAAAQSGGEFVLRQSTFDGGGGTSTGGGFILTGTIGQPDVDTVMTGGGFVLNGGFWPGTYGCVVNLTDLALFFEEWLYTGSDLIADFDDSGTVDIEDFAEIAYWWLYPCPSGWTLK